jgi:medium-chain acyl-[acyl-carrier-protein] hydrolase
VPVTAFMGDDDGFLVPEHVRAWKDQTTADFALHTCAGDHAFVRREQAFLLQILSDRFRTM